MGCENALAMLVREMLKLREIVAYLVALIAMAGGLISVASVRGASSDTMASWVQAFGSIAAIVVVTLPVLLQQSLNQREARKATLSTVESAYGTMQMVAQRYVDPDYPTSEWWVPHWRIMENALAQCPIYQCGSSEAVSAFLNFREHFTRAEAIADADDAGSERPALGGFVGFIMTNASKEVDCLRRLLK